MIGIIVIDLPAFKELPGMKPVPNAAGVDEDSPKMQLLNGKRTPVQYSARRPRSFSFISDISGLEDEIGPNALITHTLTPEAIFGYRRQVVIDDEPQWTLDSETGERTAVMEEVPAEPAARALYDSCYPRLPYIIDDGEGGTITITPPLLCGAIQGHRIDHLLL